MGIDGDAVGAAMRLLACQSLGLSNPKDLRTLLAGQLADGGWALTWCFRYGNANIKIGSREVVTAMAIRGIATALGRDTPR